MKKINNKWYHTEDEKLRMKKPHKKTGKCWNKKLTKKTHYNSDSRVKKWCDSLKGRKAWNKGKKGSMKRVITYMNFIRKLKGKDKPNLGKKFDNVWKHNISVGSKGKILTKKHKENIRKKVIERISNGEIKRYETSIELKIKKVLNNLKINYVFQYNFNNRFLCDFAIPKKKIIIECDGDYWHSRKDMKIRDKRKNAYIKKCGWKMLRLKEHNINNNINLCINKIKMSLALK